MKDQADVLREKMSKVRQGHGKSTKVIAVVSGKGGVGKSNFVVNFALALQKLNNKVIIFDLDIGMANVDILLGQTTSHSIVDMLENNLNIWDIVETGPGGLAFIAGGTGLTDLFEIDHPKMDKFISQLTLLEEEYDYIIFDMAAGVSKSSLQFLLSAHEIILVTTPEPTSITDAYATVKFVHHQDDEIPMSIVVNRTKSRKDGVSTAENMSKVSSKFLNKELKYLTSVPDDDVVSKSVRSQTPFIIMSPKAKSSQAVMAAAKSYLANKQVDDEKNTIQGFLTKLTSFFPRKGE